MIIDIKDSVVLCKFRFWLQTAPKLFILGNLKTGSKSEKLPHQ